MKNTDSPNVSRIFFALLLFLFTTGSCLGKSLSIPNFQPPKKENVVWMESVSVDTLKVDMVVGTRPGFIEGRLIDLSRTAEVGIIHYIIKTPQGAVLWEEKRASFEFDKYDGVPFSLDLGGVAVSKGSQLFVNVYNKQSELIAEGVREVALQRFILLPEIEALSIEKGENEGIARFILNNKTAEILEVEPVVEIFDRDQEKNIGTYRSGVVELGAEQTETFEVSFGLPSDPQVYVLKAFFKNKDGQQVGGALTKNFLIEGNFAEVKTFELLEETLKAKAINFIFTGAATRAQDLIIEIKVSQMWEGTVVDTLSGDMQIETDKEGRFRGSLGLVLEEDADYFVAEILVHDGENVIGRSQIEKSLVIAPSLEEVIKEQKEQEKLEKQIDKAKWWMRKDSLVWGIVLLMLVLFATNNWLRLHKKVLKILLFSVFLTNTVLAAGPTGGDAASAVGADAPMVWWRHPAISWYFNPKATAEVAPLDAVGFEHFAKIRFKGEILSETYIDTLPLFRGANSGDPDIKPTPIVLVEFKNVALGKHDWVSVDPGTIAQNFDELDSNGDYLSVTDSVRFEFEINTADPADGPPLLDTGTPLHDFLVDGEWEYTLYLCMKGTDYSCSGADGKWYASTSREIHIDSTDPVLATAHDGDGDKQLHSLSITAEQTALDAKVLDRETALSNKRIKEDLRETALSEKAEKDGVLAETEWRVLERARDIDILSVRINQITADIANYLYIPTDEKNILNTEKAALIATRSSHETAIVTLDAEIATLMGEIATLASTIATLGTQISTYQSTIDDAETGIGGISTLRASIEAIRRTAKKRDDGVAFSIDCLDDAAGGAGCHDDVYDLTVNGNFCDDPAICDTTGARMIKICDKVGNCVDPTSGTNPDLYSNDIDWYDAVAPEATVEIETDDDDDGLADTPLVGSSIKAGEFVAFALSGTADYRQKDGLSQFGVTLSADFNPDACGANSNPLLYADSGVCVERILECASSATERGEQEIDSGGVCGSICGPGYIYDEAICKLDCDQRSLELCLPGILGRGDCSPTNYNDWTPSASLYPAGTYFMQENKCGNRRQVQGTYIGTTCADINVFDCAPFTGLAQFQ